MSEELSARVDRLERLVEILADKQAKLDDVIVLLTEAQIRTEERFRETDQRFRDIEARFRETDDRSRQTDQRIDKLVSAIGEFIRKQNGTI